MVIAALEHNLCLEALYFSGQIALDVASGQNRSQAFNAVHERSCRIRADSFLRRNIILKSMQDMFTSSIDQHLVEREVGVLDATL